MAQSLRDRAVDCRPAVRCRCGEIRRFASRRLPAACSSRCRRQCSSRRSFRPIPPRPARWQGPTDCDVRACPGRGTCIHIVLDGFQSDVFGEILAEERPPLDRSLSGAVYFANHTGAFPTTIASIPAMLTGKVYRNDRPCSATCATSSKEGSIFKSLRASGYRVDAATGMHHGKESATNYFRLQRPYVSYDDYIQFTRVAACRPVAVQARAAHTAPVIYNDESWRLQALFGPATRARGGTTRSTAPSCSMSLRSA